MKPLPTSKLSSHRVKDSNCWRDSKGCTCCSHDLGEFHKLGCENCPPEPPPNPPSQPQEGEVRRLARIALNKILTASYGTDCLGCGAVNELADHCLQDMAKIPHALPSEQSREGNFAENFRRQLEADWKYNKGGSELTDERTSSETAEQKLVAAMKEFDIECSLPPKEMLRRFREWGFTISESHEAPAQADMAIPQSVPPKSGQPNISAEAREWLEKELWCAQQYHISDHKIIKEVIRFIEGAGQ